MFAVQSVFFIYPQNPHESDQTYFCLIIGLCFRSICRCYSRKWLSGFSFCTLLSIINNSMNNIEEPQIIWEKRWSYVIITYSLSSNIHSHSISSCFFVFTLQWILSYRPMAKCYLLIISIVICFSKFLFINKILFSL